MFAFIGVELLLGIRKREERLDFALWIDLRVLGQLRVIQHIHTRAGMAGDTNISAMSILAECVSELIEDFPLDHGVSPDVPRVFTAVDYEQILVSAHSHIVSAYWWPKLQARCAADAGTYRHGDIRGSDSQ